MGRCRHNITAEEASGTIALDMPANVMASAGLRFTHNTVLSSCVGSADDHNTAPNSADIGAISTSSGLAVGTAGYTYTSNLTAQDPATLTSDQVVVRSSYDICRTYNIYM